MVAAALLLVGVLGVTGLVDVANRTATEADGRAAATSIARRVAEAARGLTAPDLTSSAIAARLQSAAPDLRDSVAGDSAWTVRRKGSDYAISATVCAVDDPTDGTAAPAARDSSFCSQPPMSNPADARPDDYRRVTVSVSRAGRDPFVVRQVVTVPSASAGELPQVTRLTMRGADCTTQCPPITAASASSATFDATTTALPASLTWTVDGTPVAGCPPVTVTCSGSGNAWAFTWDLGTAARDAQGRCVAGSYVLDGVRQIGAAGYDPTGQTAGPSAVSVAVNRCTALAPASLKATGRDRDGVPIDVEWKPNREGDIAGYRVYRGNGTTWTPVCPASVAQGQVLASNGTTACTDASPPAYSKNASLLYAVAALDRDPNGSLREGPLSTIDVNTGNAAPFTPLGLLAVRSGAGVTLTWTLPVKEDPDAQESVTAFRIYRRAGTAAGAPALADRFDHEARSAVCQGSACTWTDTAASGTQTYWITAVDPNLRESAPAGGRSL